ncbi:TauD/TfdA dioxygenase family protein [Nocardia beijingensis]
MRTVPLTASIGVELQDVDLSQPFDDQEIATIRDAFDHGLVLVRGQQLADEDQDRFVATLGQLHTFRWGSTVEYMSNVIEDNPSPAGRGPLLFHNDGAHQPHVSAGTCLYAQDVSSTSPPTAFADSVRAYEGLPEEIRQEIDALHAFNMFDSTVAQAVQKRMRLAAYPEGADLSHVRATVHPVVVTVPHTGKKALFVNELNTSHIVEYGPYSRAGEELLQTLFAALYDESNRYYHHYRNHDLVLFNNLAVQHARTGWIDRNPRTLRRLVLKTLNW